MKIVAALIAALAVGAFQQSSIQSNRTESTAFTRIERIGEANARAFFVFSTGRGFSYTIRHDGYTEAAVPNVLRRRNFELKMGLAGRLDRVYFLEYEGDLLLIYETTNGKQTRAFLERMDQKTSKLRWITAIDGFNLGPGLVEGNDAYLVAANLLARVDLQTGSYLWQTPTEEQDESPNEQFLPPQVTNDHVVFQVDAEKGRTIEVDKATGKILKIGSGKE